MARKLPYILTLKVSADVDRSEFEPDAQWEQTSRTMATVTQKVYKNGGMLVGATDTFWESLSDAVGDTDRFVSLVLNPDA